MKGNAMRPPCRRMIVAFLLAATASGCSRKAPTLVEVAEGDEREEPMQALS